MFNLQERRQLKPEAVKLWEEIRPHWNKLDEIEAGSFGTEQLLKGYFIGPMGEGWKRKANYSPPRNFYQLLTRSRANSLRSVVALREIFEKVKFDQGLPHPDVYLKEIQLGLSKDLKVSDLDKHQKYILNIRKKYHDFTLPKPDDNYLSTMAVSTLSSSLLSELQLHILLRKIQLMRKK